MDWKRLALVSFLAGGTVWSGCGDGGGGDGDDGDDVLDGGPVPDMCTGGGDTHFYVLNEMIVSPETDVDGNEGCTGAACTHSRGFDLDGTSANACASGTVKDYTDPSDTSVTGVDNQLAALAKVLAALPGGNAIDIDVEIAEQIQTGDLLLLVEVSDVNSSGGLTNDDCVTVNLLLGVVPSGSTLMLDADNQPTAGQTFDVDTRLLMADMMTPAVNATGAIQNGVLNISVSQIPLSFEAMGTEIDLDVESARMRFDITATGLANGRFAGGLNVDDLTAEITEINPTFGGLAGGILSMYADLEATGSTCESISATLLFEGRPATRGVIVTGDADAGT